MKELDKKIVIEEKIEIKEIELQADPCRGNNDKPCKYDCCEDCYEQDTSYKTMWY